MDNEQLQSGAIANDPNEQVEESQDLGVTDGPGTGDQATEETKEEVAEEAVSAE